MVPGVDKGRSVGGSKGGTLEWSSDVSNQLLRGGDSVNSKKSTSKKKKRRVGFLEAQIRGAAGLSRSGSDVESSDDGGQSSAGDIEIMPQKNHSVKDQSGLNPNRIRGFAGVTGGNEMNASGSKVETPSLNQMMAKQGAIVAKFMTFFKRKSTLVIEMYEACFYKEKPKWDQIADFVYKDLCPTDDLRKAVVDVQLHPVKMLIFIRFAEDKFRDLIVSRIRSSVGVTWSEYRVKVKGYSLDSKVKFIRLLGVSPETEGDEIVRVFKETGIGDVIELKKGFLDRRDCLVSLMAHGPYV